MDRKGVVVRKRRKNRIEDKIFKKNIALSGGFIKMTRIRNGKAIRTLFNTNFKGISEILKRIRATIMKKEGRK